MEKAIAVIDIGMTNKKVAVYDAGLRMLDSVSRTFEPVMVEGLETHDLEGMEAWFLDRLADFGKSHRIGAIAVTTHGATVVCVGADGRACAPCVYYTYEPGAEFQERFYAIAGDRRELQASTGTPPLSAMINPAKGLLFLEERFPEAFARARELLNYPQYWARRLTGKSGAEGTYTGCHSYFWDWKTGRYSSVAERLGVAGMMPFPLRDSWDVLGVLEPDIAKRTGLEPDVIVTMGIHDSNASLLPHLAKKRDGDFILNSTGTWCVLMHPQESYGFASDELGKIVFFNRSAYNKPVKTAIFLGGMEYEAWTRAIAAAAGSTPAGLPEPGPEVYRSVAVSAVGVHPAGARARIGPVPRLGGPGGRGRPRLCLGRHGRGPRSLIREERRARPGRPQYLARPPDPRRPQARRPGEGHRGVHRGRLPEERGLQRRPRRRPARRRLRRWGLPDGHGRGHRLRRRDDRRGRARRRDPR